MGRRGAEIARAIQPTVSARQYKLQADLNQHPINASFSGEA